MGPIPTGGLLDIAKDWRFSDPLDRRNTRRSASATKRNSAQHLEAAAVEFCAMTEVEYLVSKLFDLADRGEADRVEYAERVCGILGRVGFSSSATSLVFLHLAHPEAIVPPAKPPGQPNPMRDQFCFGLALGWRPAALWLQAHGRAVSAGNLCRVFRAELMGKHRAAAMLADQRSWRWVSGMALVAIGEQRADAMAKAAERWAASLGTSASSSAPTGAASVAPCCAALRPELKEGIDLFSFPSQQAAARSSAGNSAEDPAQIGERPPILGLPRAIWDPALTDHQVHGLALKWWQTFKPVGHDPADFLGAILAARQLAKGPHEKYVNAVLSNGVRPDWKRKAAELMAKHAQRQQVADFARPQVDEAAREKSRAILDQARPNRKRRSQPQTQTEEVTP